MATPVYLVDARGDVLEFADPEQAQYAIRSGLKPASVSQTSAFIAKDQRAKEFSSAGEQAATAVEGGLRGLTFGLSDPLLSGLGITDAERMAARREENPTLAGAAEIVGAFAPVLAGAFVPGAVGALARATPTARLAAASEGIGEAAATGLLGAPIAGAPVSIARRAVQSGVSELVEGVPYGLGAAVSEATLGDLDLTSEEALATVGLGTLLGGGLGAAMGATGGALGRAISGSQRGLGRALDLFEQRYPGWIAGQVGAKEADVRYLMRNADQLVDGVKAEDVLAGAYPEPVAPAPFVKGVAPADTVFDPPETIDVGGVTIPNPVMSSKQEAFFAKDLTDALREAQESVSKIQSEFNTAFRPQEREVLLRDVTPETAQEQALKALKNINDVIARGTVDGPDTFSAATLGELKKIRDGFVRHAFSPDDVPVGDLAGAPGAVGASVGGRSEARLVTPSMPRGEPVRYEVVEADTLIPSHRAKTLRPNPDYPAGVQERVYEGSGAEQTKVGQIEKALDPALVLSDTPTPVDGPPIVTAGDKRFVLGGNGRAMGIQRAFSSPDVVEGYRAELLRRAGGFGIDPAVVAGMKRPVLVRVATDIPDTADQSVMAAAVRRYNEGLTREIGARARGVADAKLVSRTTLDDLAAMFDATPDQSLRELMKNQPDKFIASLRRDGLVTDANVDAWIAGSGDLTEMAKDRIEGMFLGRVVGNATRLSALPAGVVDRVARAVPALMRVETANPGLGEGALFRQALDLIASAKTPTGAIDLGLLTRQTDAFRAPDPRALALARVLVETPTAADLGKRLKAWGVEASKGTDLVRKSMSRAESRRMLMGAVDDLPDERLAADVVDPDVEAQKAFAAPSGGGEPVAGAVAAAPRPRVPSASAPRVYAALDDMKSAVQRAQGQVLAKTTVQGPGTREAMSKLSGNLRAILTDETPWGVAGARQAAINDAYTAMIDAEKNGMPLVSRKETRGSMKVPVISEDATSTFLRGATPEKVSRVKTMLESQLRFVDEVKNTADAIGAQFDKQDVMSAMGRAAKAIDLEKEARLAKNRQLAEKKVAGRKRTQWVADEKDRAASAKVASDAYKADLSVRNKELKSAGKAMRNSMKWNGFMDLIGASAVGSNPMLAPLFIAYRFGKYLGSPDKTIRVLNQVKKAAATTRAAMDAMADGFVRGERVARTAATMTISDAMIDTITQDPETAMDVLADSTADLRDFAPETAQRMESAAVRGASYLASIRPKPTVGAFGSLLPPSSASVAEYESVKAVVEEPKVAFVLASEGRLMRSQVDALQQVYPRVMDQMRVATMDALTGVLAEGRKPSFRVLQQASIIVGGDLTGTQKTIASNQAAIAEKPKQASPARAMKSTLPSRLETPWEASEGN